MYKLVLPESIYFNTRAGEQSSPGSWATAGQDGFASCRASLVAQLRGPKVLPLLAQDLQSRDGAGWFPIPRQLAVYSATWHRIGSGFVLVPGRVTKGPAAACAGPSVPAAVRPWLRDYDASEAGYSTKLDLRLSD